MAHAEPAAARGAGGVASGSEFAVTHGDRDGSCAYAAVFGDGSWFERSYLSGLATPVVAERVDALGTSPAVAAAEPVTPAVAAVAAVAASTSLSPAAPAAVAAAATLAAALARGARGSA